MLQALQPQARLQSYEERSLGQGADAMAMAFAEISVEGSPGTTYGAGQHASIVAASVRAVLSGLNRACAKLPPARQAQFFGALAQAA